MDNEQINLNDEQELWKECQKSQDPPSAYALVNLMRDISEQCICARWSIETEITLWLKMQKRKMPKDRFWGLSQISIEDLNQLHELSLKCNGWWIWNDQKPCKQFLRLSEAKKYFD